MKDCESCQGKGVLNCQSCKGTGAVDCSECPQNPTPGHIVKHCDDVVDGTCPVCPKCGGNPTVICPVCGGSGFIGPATLEYIIDIYRRRDGAAMLRQHDRIIEILEEFLDHQTLIRMRQGRYSTPTPNERAMAATWRSAEANMAQIEYEQKHECGHDGSLYGDHEYFTFFCSKCHKHICPECLEIMPKELETHSRHPECQAKVDEKKAQDSGSGGY